MIITEEKCWLLQKKKIYISSLRNMIYLFIIGNCICFKITQECLHEHESRLNFKTTYNHTICMNWSNNFFLQTERDLYRSQIRWPASKSVTFSCSLVLVTLLYSEASSTSTFIDKNNFTLFECKALALNNGKCCNLMLKLNTLFSICVALFLLANLLCSTYSELLRLGSLSFSVLNTGVNTFL